MAGQSQPEGAGPLAAAEAELFKALAHPARARVLRMLTAGPASVMELCAATGLKPSHLAGHLSQLRAQHLVIGTRSGGRLLYVLSVPQVAWVLSAADSVLTARAAVEAEGLAGISAFESVAPNAGSENVGALLEELVPIMEESMQTRALIARAVESIRVRTGSSPEAAQAALLAQALERHRTLIEVARDAVAGIEPE